MKKSRIVIFVSILICILFCSPVWAEGWANTNWGMSISEVEKAINGKVIANEGGQVYSHKLQNKLSVDKYNFEVMFHFTNNKLDKVLLRNETDDYHVAYLFLLDELKKKYGAPSDGPKNVRNPLGRREKVEWVTKGMVIDLSTSFDVLGGKTYKMTAVIYDSRKSESSEKL